MSGEFLYVLLPALIGSLFAYYWNRNSEEEDDEEK